jgi:hypothetical protein
MVHRRKGGWRELASNFESSWEVASTVEKETFSCERDARREDRLVCKTAPSANRWAVLSSLSDSVRIWARYFDLSAAHILLLDFTFARLLCSIVLAFFFAIRQSRSLPATFSSPHVAMLCRLSSALCRKHSRPSFLNARLAQEARVLCAPGRLRGFLLFPASGTLLSLSWLQTGVRLVFGCSPGKRLP